MRKVIWFLLLFSLPVVIKAQAFMTMDFITPRAGLMYRHEFSKVDLGVYGIAQYGIKNRELLHFQTAKVNAGLALPYDGENFVLYGGLSYHWYWDIRNDDPRVDFGRVQPLSLDLGISHGADGFIMLFLCDPINREMLVGITYRFKQQKLIRNEKEKAQRGGEYYDSVLPH